MRPRQLWFFVLVVRLGLEHTLNVALSVEHTGNADAIGKREGKDAALTIGEVYAGRLIATIVYFRYFLN